MWCVVILTTIPPPRLMVKQCGQIEVWFVKVVPKKISMDAELER